MKLDIDLKISGTTDTEFHHQVLAHLDSIAGELAVGARALVAIAKALEKKPRLPGTMTVRLGAPVPEKE